MRNLLQQLNQDYLQIADVSYQLRQSLILDLLQVNWMETDLVFETRLLLLQQFLEQEYENISYVQEAIENLEKCSLNVVDLYDILNLITDNQGFEMGYSANLSNYLVYMDSHFNSGFDSISLTEMISNNTNISCSLSDKITANNQSIEKIKRKEM